MIKEYKAANLYYLKMIITMIIIVLVCALYFLVFSSLLRFGRITDFIFGIVFGGIAAFVIYVIIISNKPVVRFENEALIYRYKKISFSDIADFQKSKGGSEPYIITHEGKRIDLELSWLKKQDREEIEHFLQSQLNHE